jgi:threonine synthase
VPVTHLDCSRCNQRYEPGQILTVCTACGGPLFARYDLERAAKNMRPGHLALREPTLWRYDDVLPVDSPDHRVSLGEGFTPLLTARRLGSQIGLPRLFIKDESGEPTGSFKARGLSLAVSMAKALGATDVCLPSAGNAGSALAAYAAKGGLKAHVFVPKDIAQLFLMETRAYGAEVETVDGLITDAGKVCAERAK